MILVNIFTVWLYVGDVQSESAHQKTSSVKLLFLLWFIGHEKQEEKSSFVHGIDANVANY